MWTVLFYFDIGSITGLDLATGVELVAAEPDRILIEQRELKPPTREALLRRLDSGQHYFGFDFYTKDMEYTPAFTSASIGSLRTQLLGWFLVSQHFDDYALKVLNTLASKASFSFGYALPTELYRAKSEPFQQLRAIGTFLNVGPRMWFGKKLTAISLPPEHPGFSRTDFDEFSYLEHKNKDSVSPEDIPDYRRLREALQIDEVGF